VNALGRLIRDLDRARVRVWLSGDRIAYSGPLTPAHAKAIQRYRRDVIELLRLHGDALLPLFRDPARPLTVDERALIEANAAKLRRRFRLASQAPRTSDVRSVY
jgi:hypothetical protein